jgi:hypothetical protein
MHGVANGHGGYALFDACSLRANGQTVRGARATCGYELCKTSHTVSVNTFANGLGDDEDKAERYVTRKFEAIGWKIGKTAKGNLCPGCFAKVKQASAKTKPAKEKEEVMSSEKVVPITPPPAVEPPRAMTRDDGRIIFNKIDENYAGESVGYALGWSDERIAKDLGVPRAWVAEIRDKYFGPDIDEKHTQVLAEAKALLAETNATAAALMKRIDMLAQTIKSMGGK